MRIDLNADLGEGFGRWGLGCDEALLDVVTSANVACGFHAGDPSILRRTCAAAARRGVSTGAHPGYHDLVGFGRRFVDMPPTELADDVLYQLGALRQFARIAGVRVSHVKPHGALYNAIVDHEEQARAVVAAVVAFDPRIAVLGLPGSSWLRQAEAAGLTVVREMFADRAYAPDGTLVPRSEPEAVLTEPVEVAERCVRMAVHGEVATVDGSIIALRADSICVHGDSPNAVRIATAVRTALDRAGVSVAPFAAAS